MCCKSLDGYALLLATLWASLYTDTLPAINRLRMFLYLDDDRPETLTGCLLPENPQDAVAAMAHHRGSINLDGLRCRLLLLCHIPVRICLQHRSVHWSHGYWKLRREIDRYGHELYVRHSWNTLGLHVRAGANLSAQEQQSATASEDHCLRPNGLCFHVSALCDLRDYVC